jgi:hypothetical protein
MLARQRMRSKTKIDSKNSLYSYRHFTEHLMDMFEKSPWESDFNYKISSFLIRQLKNMTETSPATIPHHSMSTSTQASPKTEPLFHCQAGRCFGSRLATKEHSTGGLMRTRKIKAGRRKTKCTQGEARRAWRNQPGTCWRRETLARMAPWPHAPVRGKNTQL